MNVFNAHLQLIRKNGQRAQCASFVQVFRLGDARD